jgi:hypothetical protein
MAKKQILQQGGDGTAVPTGMVGETKTVSFDFNTATAAVYSTSSVLSLTAGYWNVMIVASHGAVSGLTVALAGISTDSGATTFSDLSISTPNFCEVKADGSSFTPVVSVSQKKLTSGALSLYGKVRCTGANVRIQGYIEAIRIG